MYSLDQELQNAIQKISSGDVKGGREILKKLQQSKNTTETERLIGITYALEQQYSESIDWFVRSIKIDNQNSAAHMNLGSAYQAINLDISALECFNKAILINHNNIDALKNRGNLLFKLKKFQQALRDYEDAESLAANDIDVLTKKTTALMKLGQYGEAYKTAEKITVLDENNYEGYFYKGVSSLNLGILDGAEYSLKKALQLKVWAIEAHIGLSAVLHKKGQKQEALECCEQGIKYDSHSPEIWLNKGRILEDFGKLEQAETSYINAIHNKLDYIEAHKNLASLYLKTMRFNEVWQEYEWRESNRVLQKEKTWDGTKVKKLYVISEQGIGDQILYASLFNDLQNYAENIKISCSPKLLKLFARSFPKIYFISNAKDEIGSVNENIISLASLPRYLRKNINDFPKKIEPFIKANPDLTISTGSKEYPVSKRLCGLSWFSINSENGESKSIKLEDLLPLMSNERYSFINLQYGEVGYEIDTLKAKNNIEILHFKEIDLFDDLESLTSMIAQCDIVVTTSNSTAHLCGAMGKQTYLLLPSLFDRHWYWVERDGKSLWYPSIQIIEYSRKTWDNSIIKLTELIKRTCH